MESIQKLIDDVASSAPYTNKLAVVVGSVTPDNPEGELDVSSTPVYFRGSSSETQPLKPTTPFALASVSKLFTTDIFQRIIFGDMGYPASSPKTVGQLLPWVSTARVADIPVNDIATYASGLPPDNGYRNRSGFDYPWPSDMYCTLTDMFNGLADYDYQKLGDLSYGNYYVYSNASFDILSVAALGLPQPQNEPIDTENFLTAWNKVLQEYCIEVIGQSSQTILYHAMSSTDGLPCGYNYSGNNDDPLVATTAAPGPADSGAGGVVSTGADMLQYLRYCMGLNIAAPYPWPLLNERATYKSWCDSGATSQTLGDGWFILQNPNGTWNAWKNGGVPGFTSWIGIHWPQGQAGPDVPARGLFVLTNTNSNNATTDPAFPDAGYFVSEIAHSVFQAGEAPELLTSPMQGFNPGADCPSG